MATPLRTVPGTNGDPLAEAIELTRRLKLPHLRRVLADLIPTAKAQRWDPAEVVRVLLAEEAAGRDRANLHTRRKRAGFPTGKTFGDWDETKSAIPLTGTATFTRSSAAETQNVDAPPPLMPVTPIRSGSTSVRLTR